MAITPGPGYMIDPNNPNAVIPIGSSAQAQGLGVYNTGTNPNTPNISYGAVNPGTATVTRTSNPAPAAPAQIGTPQYSTQLAQQAQSLGVPNVPQSLLTPPTQQPAPNLSTASVNTPNAIVKSTGGVPTGQVGFQPLLSSAAPSFGGLVGALSNTSAAGSPAAPIAIGGLLNTAGNQANYQQAYSAYQNAYKTYQDLQSKIATQFGNLETSDQALPVVLGTEGALQRQYAAQLDAAQGAVSAAAAALSAATNQQATTQTGFNEAGTLGTTAQGLVQSGLGTAANLAYPMTLTPPQYLVSPTTGESPSGASQSQGYQNYAQWQAAQGNVNIGQQNQQTAASLQGALKNYDVGNTSFVNFLSANGLNQQNVPFFNNPINSWIGTFQNPAAVTAVNDYVNDLQTFQGQLLQSGVDLTPTGTQGQLLQTNPLGLSIPELVSLGQVMQQLGQIRYTTASSQAQGAFNAASQPGNLYTGGGTSGYPQTPVVIPQVNATQNMSQQNWMQFAGGTGVNIVNALGSLTGIGSGFVGGALEGLGSSLLAAFF